MKACELKLPITEHFELLPPSIYCHKLQWTKCAAVSEFAICVGL